MHKRYKGKLLRSKRERVIEKLRKLYPDEAWSYDRDEGQWKSDKRMVAAFSRLTPQYDGDDTTYITEYMDNNYNLIFSKSKGVIM